MEVASNIAKVLAQIIIRKKKTKEHTEMTSITNKRLRILYIVSINCGMAGEAGGVLRLFRSYCDAAKMLEHEIELFSLWQAIDWTTVDLVHFAPCDAGMLGVARALRENGVRFVVSPILDKTFPALALRAVLLPVAIASSAATIAATWEPRRRYAICQMASASCRPMKGQESDAVSAS